MGTFKRRFRIAVSVAAVAATLAGCVDANEIAMRVGAPPESAVNLRAMQTRRFDTLDEKALMEASTQTLQDLGFIISESSSDVGVLVASKRRDAEEAGQIAGQIVLTLVLAALGTYNDPTWDKEQTIHVTLVASPVENSKQVEVRVTFDRVLTNNKGQQWRAELIKEPDIYKQFFEKLAKGAFLEAHAL
jgi:hypothetical protein